MVSASLRKCLMLKRGGVVSLVGAGGKTSLMFRIARELSEAGESVLTTTTTKIFPPTKEQSPYIILSVSLKEILKRAKMLLKDTLHLSAAFGQADARGKLPGFPPEFIDELWKARVFQWILVEADGAARRPLKAPASHEPVIPESSGWLIAVVGLDAVGRPLGEKWVFRPELYADITGLSLGESVTEASVGVAIIHEKGMMKKFGIRNSESGISGNRAVFRFVFLNKADHPGGPEAGRKIAGFLEKHNNESALKGILIGKALHDPPIMKYYAF